MVWKNRSRWRAQFTLMEGSHDQLSTNLRILGPVYQANCCITSGREFLEYGCVAKSRLIKRVPAPAFFSLLTKTSVFLNFSTNAELTWLGCIQTSWWHVWSLGERPSSCRSFSNAPCLRTSDPIETWVGTGSIAFWDASSSELSNC